MNLNWFQIAFGQNRFGKKILQDFLF